MSIQSEEQSNPFLDANDNYIAQTNRSISMICHDRHFRDTVFLTESGTTLFALEAASVLKSWSLKRTLRDAAGAVVLLVRHSKSSGGLEHWYVEDAHGKRLCDAKGSKMFKDGATRIDATVLSGVESGSIITLRSVDHAGSSTAFEVGGVGVAEMVLVANNDLSFLGQRGLDRSAWKLNVKAGTDMAMVAALAICRVEVLHAWRR